jgi:hypothetical protein
MNSQNIIIKYVNKICKVKILLFGSEEYESNLYPGPK